MRKRVRLIIGAMAVAICLALSLHGEENPHSPERKEMETSSIKRKSTLESRVHPLTPEEIISLRKPLEVQVSPDGKQVVFVVQQGFLRQNDSRVALFVLDIENKHEPVKLFEESSLYKPGSYGLEVRLSQVRWTPDGNRITFLSNKSGSLQVWQVQPGGGTPVQVTHHVPDVTEYAWSPDGRKIALLSTASITESEREETETSGFVFSDRFHITQDLIWRTWIRKHKQVWLYDLLENKEELAWEDDQLLQKGSDLWVGGLLWSPDSRKVAFHIVPAAIFSSSKNLLHIGYYSLDKRQFMPLVTDAAFNRTAAWSADSRSLEFLAGSTLFTAKLDGGAPVKLADRVSFRSHVWRSPDGLTVYFERTDDQKRSGVYAIPFLGGEARKVSRTEDHLHSCSFDKLRAKAACFRENPMTPAEVAILDVQNGAVGTLTALNPEFRSIRLGEVSFLQWENKNTADGCGYLIKPLDYVDGKRYPLLVITYGFDGGFISQAQWIPNYPAQIFAGRDFVVLLANTSGCPALAGRQQPSTDPLTANMYGPMASLENAIQKLVDRGVVDSQKAGIMGLSYGSSLTQFVISHSNAFRAASAGDGGAYGPFAYVVAAPIIRRYLESILGGPPYGESSKIWQQVAPALNADHVNTPLLMEFVATSISALEVFTALRRHKKPVELVFYPDETHILYKPRARFAAMQRNLDWFSFWLQGKEDPDPTKADQYVRWRELRKLQGASVKPDASSR